MFPFPLSSNEHGRSAHWAPALCSWNQGDSRNSVQRRWQSCRCWIPSLRRERPLEAGRGGSVWRPKAGSWETFSRRVGLERAKSAKETRQRGQRVSRRSKGAKSSPSMTFARPEKCNGSQLLACPSSFLFTFSACPAEWESPFFWESPFKKKKYLFLFISLTLLGLGCSLQDLPSEEGLS